MKTRRPSFQPPPRLDFREDKSFATMTTILVYANHVRHEWVIADHIDLTEMSNQRGKWSLGIRTRNATDFEHDRAIALRVELTGVALRLMSDGTAWIDGFIAGDDPEDFQVPMPEWNQFEGAVKCKDASCRAKDQQHLIVSESKYVPPPNPELFERVRGLRVEIIVSTV